MSTHNAHWTRFLQTWFSPPVLVLISTPLYAGTVPNGQQCTTDTDCQSASCYPFPPYGGAYCMSKAMNCTDPRGRTEGQPYGVQITLNGSTYTCANPGDGRATWLPRGKANGIRCNAGSECQSGGCAPFPPDNANYCVATNVEGMHCAKPNAQGGVYGERITWNGKTYQCSAPGGGQPAMFQTPGTNANGVQCGAASECVSGVCYPYTPENNNYCMSVALNCALPGKDGARYGSTVNINGSVYTCANPGNGPATWLPPGKPNGTQCSKPEDCQSKTCWLYVDNKTYCMNYYNRCALPNSGGAGWGATTTYGGQTYQCLPVGYHNWVNASCPTMQFQQLNQCRSDLKSPNYCLPKFPVSTGYGEVKDCSGYSDLEFAQRAACNIDREAQKGVGKITQTELEHSASIARQTAKPIPPHIYDHLKCLFEPEVFYGVKSTSNYSPDGRLNAILYCLAGAGMGQGLPGCVAGILNSPAGWQDLAYYTGEPTAITFGPDIITFRSKGDAENNVILWAHELEHARQYRNLGTNGFADMYTYAQGTMEFDAERKELFACYSLAKNYSDPNVLKITDCRSNDFTCREARVTPDYCEGLRKGYAARGHNHPIPATQVGSSSLTSKSQVPIPAPAPVPSSPTASQAKPVIVDNRAQTVIRTGKWCPSQASGFYGTDSEFAGNNCDTKGRHAFRWVPTPPLAGTYDVFIWWPNHSNRSKQAPFTVHHAVGDTVKTFNQQTGGGKWVLHGRYTFAAGTSAWVEVDDRNGPIGADAVQFVPAP